MNNIIVKVKLFGESLKIHSLEFKKEHFPMIHEIALKLNEPINNALLNIKFYQFLNLKNISSVQDFVKNTLVGLNNTKISQVEIWLGRKRIQKFNVNELFHQKTLFPLFNVRINNLFKLNLKPGIYLEEKEVGLIDTYSIELKNFDINLLKFDLLKFNHSNTNYELLTKVSYNKKSLKLIKQDTVLRYQNCFIKHS